MVNTAQSCTRTGRIYASSEHQNIITTDKENIEDKAKDTCYGTDRFYSVHGDTISNLRKERLGKSRICLRQVSESDINAKSARHRNSISHSKTNVKKACRKTDSQHRKKIKVKKQTVSQSRLARRKQTFNYDFSSSSVENNSSSVCFSHSSTKDETKKCDDACVPRKKFFTARASAPDEDKLSMTIFKGRHFNLAFTRGLDKSPTAIKKATKQVVRKRKKIPLPVTVKAVETISETKSNPLVTVKPFSVILTKVKLPDTNNHTNEQIVNNSVSEPNENPPIPCVVQEEQINGIQEMDDCSSLTFEDKRKEILDPAFYTSTPLKLGQLPRHVLGSCSPMKKDVNISDTPSKKLVKFNGTLSTQFPMKNINCEETSLSNEQKAFNSKQTLTENSTIPNVKYLSRKDAADPHQLIIDAGQKNLEAKQCLTCYMLYTPGNLQDEKTHKKYHESYISKLKFPIWKKQRVLGDFADGYIVMVVSSDAKYMLQKVKEIQQIIDKELGVSGGIHIKTNASYVLFVTTDHKVVGFIVVEKISHAYRVISSPNISQGSPRKVLYSERESVSALCGICRLWTAPDYRRQKIATRMLDCLRCHFIFGYLLSTDEIAFMDPTIDGRQFVEKYTGTPNYLIYFKTSAV